jgi:Zn-finger nucleic acid-binding protein
MDRRPISSFMTEPLHDPKTTRAQEREDAMRHLFGTMLCPRCGRPLDGCDHALGIAWRCGKCGGQSLNFSQFRRMIPQHGANAIWDSATARPVPPRRRTPCPECHSGMAAVNLPLNGRMVELDICLPCQRLWLDRQEDGEAAASFSLSVMPPPERGSRLRSWFAPRMRTSSAEEEEREDNASPEKRSVPGLVSFTILTGLGLGLIMLDYLQTRTSFPVRPGGLSYLGLLIVLFAATLLKRPG